MKKSIFTFISALFFSVALMAAEGHNNELPDKINVNNATPQQLDEGLLGVGEKTALAIVDYREKNGPFESTTDLMKVKRVGEKVIENNKNRIVFK